MPVELAPTRTCGYCKETIDGSHPRRKYCSQRCKDGSYSASKRESKYPSDRLALKRCPVCSSSMNGMRPHAVYCSRSCKSKAAGKRNPSTKEQNRARYLRERDRRLEYAKRYQRENPGVPKRAKRKRKARIAGAGVFEITARDWDRLVARHQGRCFYCSTKGPMSMDHVIPISRGGRHSIGNILPACINCNSQKYNSTVMEWRMRGGYRGVSAAAAAHDGSDVEENSRRGLVLTGEDLGLGGTRLAS